MSVEKSKNEDLKKFETAIRSLRPRHDGLDGRLLAILEKNTSLAAGFPVPLAVAVSAGNCSVHEFVCVRCGVSASATVGIGRFKWPAAFSAMTGIAAVLLIMLLVRTDRREFRNANERVAEMSAFLAANADQMSAQTASTSVAAEKMPCVALRNELIYDGEDWWKRTDQTAVAVFTGKDAPKEPLTYREQLNRLLKQQNSRGS